MMPLKRHRRHIGALLGVTEWKIPWRLDILQNKSLLDFTFYYLLQPHSLFISPATGPLAYL